MGASAYGDENKYYKIRDPVFLTPEGGFELNLNTLIIINFIDQTIITNLSFI